MEKAVQKTIKTLGVFVAVAGGFALLSKGAKLLSSAKMKFALIGFRIHKLDKSGLKFGVKLRCYNPTTSAITIAVNSITAMYAGSVVANSLPQIKARTVNAGATSDLEVIFDAPYLSLLSKGLLNVISNPDLFKANLSFAISLTVNGEILNTTQNLSDNMNDTVSGVGQLGIVSGPRNTQDASKYNHLIKKVDGKEVLIKNGGVYETVKACIDIVSEHYREVEDLAAMLKGRTKKETCANIFNFAYPYLQYKLDKDGIEQLRTPARSWYDGQIRYKQQNIQDAGIDCDDFSIFCGSLLKCLGIDFKFRVTKYDGKSYYQHIYVIVPDATDSQGEIVIDPVLSAFDYQKPYSEQKSDFNMKPIQIAGLGGYDISGITGLGMPIMMLSGIDTNDDLMGIISGIDFDDAITGLGAADTATLNYLKRTHKYISSNPQTISHIQNPKQFLEMIDAAIKYWDTPRRDEILDKLIAIEDKLIDEDYIKLDSVAIEGLYDLEDELGRSTRAQRKARRKKRRAGFFRSVKKVSRKVGAGLKAAAKAVIRFNPLSLAIRGGLLAALRLNMFKYSSKLKYAYLPDHLAGKYNIDASKLRDIKKAHSRLEKLFTSLQGKESNLKKAIIKGSKEKNTKDYSLKGVLEQELFRLQGLGEIGDPVTAASVTAASGVLAKIGSWLKPIKNIFNKTKTVVQKWRGKAPMKALAPISPSQAAQTISPAVVTPSYTSSYTPTIQQRSSEATFQEKSKKKMSKTTKGLIGLGLLALVGGTIYYATSHNSTTTPTPTKSKRKSLGAIALT